MLNTVCSDKAPWNVPCNGVGRDILVRAVKNLAKNDKFTEVAW